MSHQCGVSSWGSAPNPEVFRIVARTCLGRPEPTAGAGSRACPGTGASARVAPHQSPILSAAKHDCPSIMASVNHDCPLLPPGIALIICPVARSSTPSILDRSLEFLHQAHAAVEPYTVLRILNPCLRQWRTRRTGPDHGQPLPGHGTSSGRCGPWTIHLDNASQQ